MRSALVSVLGLKKELYTCKARLFRFMDNITRYIYVVRFFQFMALTNQGISLIDRGRFKSWPLFSDADSNG